MPDAREIFEKINNEVHGEILKACLKMTLKKTKIMHNNWQMLSRRQVLNGNEALEIVGNCLR